MASIGGFFAVIARGRTYLNLAYLLLAFPLGIAYFVFLVTGVSLGLGLIITIFGAPLLIGMMLAWRVLGKFERWLARGMLGATFTATRTRVSRARTSLWQRITTVLNDSYTWRSLAHLIIRFPLGIVFFVLIVTLVTTSLALIATPVVHHLTRIGVIPNENVHYGAWAFANTYWFTGIAAIVGIVLLFASLHLFNGLARLSRMIAEELLEPGSQRS